MNDFKVGDWVRFADEMVDDFNKGEILKIQSVKEHFLYFKGIDIGYGNNLFELWEPKEGEWCWFNMKFEDDWGDPTLMKYGEQDYTMWEIEPFIGELPSFIKAKL